VVITPVILGSGAITPVILRSGAVLRSLRRRKDPVLIDCWRLTIERSFAALRMTV